MAIAPSVWTTEIRPFPAADSASSTADLVRSRGHDDEPLLKDGYLDTKDTDALQSDADPVGGNRLTGRFASQFKSFLKS
jgi:hypothetical protein